jgi:pimeloyl-ACP methyl ester carboxylesterase
MQQVAGLVLLNTYYSVSPTLKFPEFISLFADPAYRNLSAAMISDPEQFAWLQRFQGGQFRRDAPPALQELMQTALAPVVRDQFAATPSAATAFMALTRDLHAALEENAQRLRELSGFGPPVALVWGAGDPYLNMGVAEHLKGQFSNAQLKALRAGHWPQIDAPEEVAKALFSMGKPAS